jgi:outer membrane protein assembly factor BamD
MSRRTFLNSFLIALLGLLVFAAGCTNKKSVNPLAGIDSKQPDKVLFDRSMDAMRHNRFDVARMTLQTLINTYPDSEFIARAKLAVGDSWYAEGGTASLAQAEQEYRDFQTFFPNMPEAAEAQLKIANIQYQQMEKPDRDFTHAKRAEEEYRNLILQYPDNAKLVAEGKRRLLEVQEVLADREFQIGRFYYYRQSYGASIARLQSLIDKYPLYSQADEALYYIGQNYEGEIARIRLAPTCTAPGKPPGCATEAAKAQAISEPTKKATEAYDRIVTRYPLLERSDDARKRLTALHQPVPRPTRAAVALNKAEIDSRSDPTTMATVMEMLKKGPDVSQAPKIGEPTLVDPTPVSAFDVQSNLIRAIVNPDNGKKAIAPTAVVMTGTPPPNEEAPRDEPARAENGNSSPFSQPAAAAADPNELKPNASPDSNANAAPDPNELKPSDAQDGTDPTLPPPPQVNEIPSGQNGATATAANAGDSTPASDQEISSSKKKKKKGIKKFLPL